MAAARVLLTAEPVTPGLLFAPTSGEPAGPDFGRWTGRGLVEVGASEPEALAAWLSDPYAAPHGGESLATTITRLGGWLDATDWAEGLSEVTTSALVARGLIVHALGAPPEAIFRVDVSPGGRVLLSRSGAFWRLQELLRR